MPTLQKDVKVKLTRKFSSDENSVKSLANIAKVNGISESEIREAFTTNGVIPSDESQLKKKVGESVGSLLEKNKETFIQLVGKDLFPYLKKQAIAHVKAATLNKSVYTAALEEYNAEKKGITIPEAESKKETKDKQESVELKI